MIGLGFAFGGAAQAEVHFDVRNCTGQTLHVHSFDGGDGSHTFTAESFKLTPQNEEGSSKHTSCNHGCAWLDDSCKAHCQISVRRDGLKRTKDFLSVPKNHYVRVLSASLHYRDDIHENGTEITYEIADTDNSCSDPVEDAHSLR